MTVDQNHKVIEIRRDTYMALRRLREDRSYPTFDQLIRDALQKAYGPGLDL